MSRVNYKENNMVNLYHRVYNHKENNEENKPYAGMYDVKIRALQQREPILS